MRVRLLLTLMLVAGSLAFVVSGRALACTCSPRLPFDKAVEEADAVFLGVVTSSEQTSGQPSFLGSTPYGNFVYTFSVDEVVLGDVGPTIEANAHSSGAACGLEFRDRTRYVVFAYESRRGLETFLCSRTERINEAVGFGGEAPEQERTGSEVGPPTGSDDTEVGPSVVMMGAAAVLGAAGLLVLLRLLLPAGR